MLTCTGFTDAQVSCEMDEEKRQEGRVGLTFPCQLAVVGLLARNDLLHQLVVAAVAHCLDDVSHLETQKNGGSARSPGTKGAFPAAISRKAMRFGQKWETADVPIPCGESH